MFILDHRALQKHQQNISSVQELEHLVAYALSHYKGFVWQFVWQFGLLIFDFSKRLDGCAVTWICQPALPGHTALSINIVQTLK